MDAAISPCVKTLAGQQDVSVQLLSEGSSTVKLPKVNTGGEFGAPLWLVDDFTRAYDKNLLGGSGETASETC